MRRYGISHRILSNRIKMIIVVSIEIELPTALENAQLPAFSSLLSNVRLYIKLIEFYPSKQKNEIALVFLLDMTNA